MVTVESSARTTITATRVHDRAADDLRSELIMVFVQTGTEPELKV